MDCRLFAVGDILDVGASHGGCELDVLVSGAGCVPHRDDWASDGGRTVVTSVSSDRYTIYRYKRADENSL